MSCSALQLLSCKIANEMSTAKRPSLLSSEKRASQPYEGVLDHQAGLVDCRALGSRRSEENAMGATIRDTGVCWLPSCRDAA